jgi:predicted phage terminase large subunit-like protein
MTKHSDLSAMMSRLSFGAFTYLAFEAVYPGRTLTPNWHIDAVCDQLQRIVEGDADWRLVLNQPPRSLKSFIVSICLPAWFLGHNPSLLVVVACYSDELSRKFSRDCRMLMESPFYKRVFPQTRLTKNTESELETTASGGRNATSVGGTLTGRGADLLIIGDPIKAQDAHSELARDNVWQWFTQTAFTRRNHPDATPVIVHMQRLHEDDLSGKLIGQNWPKMVLPAVATQRETFRLGPNERHIRKPGDLLQPGWDTPKSIAISRDQLGSIAFAAQYQQDPRPAEGNLIKAAGLARYVEQFARDRYKQVALACDPAGKPGEQNDYTAIIVAGEKDNNLHILHATRGHWTVLQMRQRIVELAGQYRSDINIVEDTASGMGLIQDLRRESRLPVIGKRPKLDKESRVIGQLGLLESGRIVLPSSASWLADFEKELLGFPSSKHDDQVDALVLLMEWFRERAEPIRYVGPIIFTWPKSSLGY